MTGIDVVAPILVASLVSLGLSDSISFIGGQRHRGALQGAVASAGVV